MDIKIGDIIQWHGEIPFTFHDKNNKNYEKIPGKVKVKIIAIHKEAHQVDLEYVDDPNKISTNYPKGYLDKGAFWSKISKQDARLLAIGSKWLHKNNPHITIEVIALIMGKFGNEVALSRVIQQDPNDDFWKIGAEFEESTCVFGSGYSLVADAKPSLVSDVKPTGTITATDIKLVTLKPEAPSNPFEKRSIKFQPIRKSGDHFSEFEQAARTYESEGHLVNAKLHSNMANSKRARDLAIDAEEKALREGNVILTAAYNLLSGTDKKAWDLKGLKVGVYYSGQIGYFYFYSV